METNNNNSYRNTRIIIGILIHINSTNTINYFNMTQTAIVKHNAP